MFSKKLLFLVCAALLLIQFATDIYAKAVSSGESIKSAADVKEEYPQDLILAIREWADYKVSLYKDITQNVINDMSIVENKPEGLPKMIERLKEFVADIEKYEKKTNRVYRDADIFISRFPKIQRSFTRQTAADILVHSAMHSHRKDLYKPAVVDELSEKAIELYVRYKGPLKDEVLDNFDQMLRWARSVKENQV